MISIRHCIYHYKYIQNENEDNILQQVLLTAYDKYATCVLTSCILYTLYGYSCQLIIQ